MSLSVCLIVKNEERVLGRCLSAAVQFADELIVVDTGSTDRSREIAREYTDLVFSEPWRKSFAKARHFAASEARCDHVQVCSCSSNGRKTGSIRYVLRYAASPGATKNANA